jgi:hypothetical protein
MAGLSIYERTIDTKRVLQQGRNRLDSLLSLIKVLDTFLLWLAGLTRLAHYLHISILIADDPRNE